MRVISGSAKGHVLKAVPGQSTRPTTDKVKEAIFSMIGPYFDGGIVLDLFAGTGGLGIEALSRGMDQAIFVDTNQESIRVVRHNLSVTNLSEQSEVYRNDAQRALKALIKRNLTFHLVMIDPPYKMRVIESIIQLLHNGNLLNHKAIIVCEHDSKVELPLEIADIRVIRNTVYGDTAITVYEKGGETS